MEGTQHGNNITNQIHVDKYGDFDNLTDYDVWNILDSLHTHMMDTRPRNDPVFGVLENALIEISGEIDLE